MTNILPQKIDNYKIEKELGTGGMGTVYRAIDENLDRPVAVKIMHDDMVTHPQFQQRFQQEGRAIAKLDHPNIIHVYHFKPSQERPYLVMEFVEGGSLRSHLYRLYKEKKYLKLSEAIQIAFEVSEALQYAHEKGMIHRDVKPDNVLMKPITVSGLGPRFQAILTDFGLAKLAEGSFNTMGVRPMGTLAYMSPEQCNVEHLDARSDIYSLGVMLYELAAGRLPFEPQTVTEAQKMHCYQPLPDPLTLRPDLPSSLVDVITRSLMKKTEERYQLASEMALALQKVARTLTGEQVTKLDTVQGDIVSVTNYMSHPIDLAMPDYTHAKTPPSGDRLVIVHEGQGTRYIAIRKQAIIIGREAGNDVILNDSKASRRHARLERLHDGTYQITDLGSTNGTLLGDARLLANVPEPWAFGQTLRIGSHWLTLEQEIEDGKTEEFQIESVRVAQPSLMFSNKPGATVFQSIDQQIQVAMMPTHIRIEAGSFAEIQVEVVNLAQTVEHFTLPITNLPPDWVTISNDELKLMPGARGTLRVTFQPPRRSTSTAGQHSFTVSLYSKSQDKEIATASGILQIAPFYRYAVDIHPHRLVNRRDTVLEITNNGNSVVNYNITARDPEAALDFQIEWSDIQIPPGQLKKIAIQMSPKRSARLSGSKTYSFDVFVKTAEGEQETASGELVLEPDMSTPSSIPIGKQAQSQPAPTPVSVQAPPSVQASVPSPVSVPSPLPAQPSIQAVPAAASAPRQYTKDDWRRRRGPRMWLWIPLMVIGLGVVSLLILGISQVPSCYQGHYSRGYWVCDSYRGTYANAGIAVPSILLSIAIASAIIYGKKGRHRWMGFLLGGFLNCFVLPVWIFLPRLAKCSYCRKKTRADSWHCDKCGNELWSAEAVKLRGR